MPLVPIKIQQLEPELHRYIVEYRGIQQVAIDTDTGYIVEPQTGEKLGHNALSRMMTKTFRGEQ